MNKKVTFLLSLLLIFTILVGTLALPASSYENNVNPTSSAILLVNLDTDTVVYERNADTTWYAGNLSELMTFIVAYQNNSDLENRKVSVTRDFIDQLDSPDGCLDRFVGRAITGRDLLAVMLLTSGSDAAYLLAQQTTNGDIDAFVDLMNQKAKELGCRYTTFTSPGADTSRSQMTSCSDMALIYRSAMGIELFDDLMASAEYVPDGFDEDKFTVTTQNSMMIESSPYYFRYVTGGKYVYSTLSASNFVCTTMYRNQSYLFVALKGKHSAEQNPFVDAKRLTTWAYLHLTNQRVVPVDTLMASVKYEMPWGKGSIELYAANAAVRTVPSDYDTADFTVKLDVPKTVSLPVFEGQNIGSAGIYYGKEKIDEVALVASRSKGVSMITDVRGFLKGAYSRLMPLDPGEEVEPTAQPTASESSDGSASSATSATTATSATSATAATTASSATAATSASSAEPSE